MADFPKDLQYTRDHEWARTDGTTITVGVTAHAVEKLGDVVLVSLDVRIGDVIAAGQSFGTVESTKAVSDLFSPVSGTVCGVNTALTEQPELVNASPYVDAWMIRIERSGVAGELLDSDAYAAHCSSEA